MSRPAFRLAALVSAGALAATLASARPVAAQSTGDEARGWGLRFTSGAFVPTGDQRASLKAAHLSAAQLTWVVRPSLAVTGTFGWARSRDRALAGAPKLDVFTSDVGLEARAGRWPAGGAMRVRPFAGAGIGARSYNHRSLDIDATNTLAGYIAAGGELDMGRVGLRLEARDYATGFKPLTGAGAARSVTRNDVVVMAGLRFNRKRTPG